MPVRAGTANTGSVDPPLEFGFLQDGGRQFLDRFAGGIKVGYAFLAHQGFGFAHFEFAVGQRGVFAAGAAFVADLLQAGRADSQSVQPAAQGFDLGWQLHGAEIFRNQRIVGGTDAELHGQVQASRCFTAA